jgi:hypothetical protein
MTKTETAQAGMPTPEMRASSLHLDIVDCQLHNAALVKILCKGLKVATHLM